MTTTTNTYTPDVTARTSSLAQRLQSAPPIQTRVRVVGAPDEYLVGRVGVLERIDGNDESLTFAVRWDDSTYDWAYEVAAVEPVEGSPRSEDNPASVEIAETREEITRLQRQVAELQGQISLVDARLVAFKAEVRDKAIEVAEERGWCDEGLNEVLEELGLEPKTTGWTGTVTVRVYGYQDVEVEIEQADDEDDAITQAQDEGIENVDAYAWQIDEDNIPEVQSVDEQS